MDYETRQQIRIVHALARIVTEIESMEQDEHAIIRALSVIEDAYFKTDEPLAYAFVFEGKDDSISVTLSVEIIKKAELE